MEKPTFADYVTLIFNLFDRFLQVRGPELGFCSDRDHFKHQTLIVFLLMMQFPFQSAAAVVSHPSG